MITRVLAQSFKKLITISAVVLLTSGGLTAQPGDTDIGDPDQGVPIDGGISILFAAGAALGARRIYLDKKNQKDKNNVA